MTKQKEFVSSNVKHVYDDHKSRICMTHENKVNINECASICSDYILWYKQSIEASKRYGILISGRWKCQKDNLFPQIIKYIREHPDTCIDIHVAINDDSYNLETYMNDTYMDAPFIASFTCERFHVPANFMQKANDLSNTLNTISSFYTLGKAYNQLAESNIIYDLVMKYRPDIVSETLPELQNLAIEKNTLYTPETNRYGHNGYLMNDQIGVGDADTMKIYCDIYQHLYSYILEENILLHPETLLDHHIQKNNIAIKLFPFWYNLDPKRKDN